MLPASGRPSESNPVSSDGSDEPLGESRDFATFVRGEFAAVWRLLRRIGVGNADADDATQQVFLVLSRKWGELGGPQLRRFLYGTTLRIAANTRRGVRRRREVSDDDASSELVFDPEQDARIERRRALAFLDEILDQLPDELRRVFVLVEIEQLTAARVAELEAIPPGTVASRLRRARAMFHELLERERHRNPFGGEPR